MISVAWFYHQPLPAPQPVSSWSSVALQQPPPQSAQPLSRRRPSLSSLLAISSRLMDSVIRRKVEWAPRARWPELRRLFPAQLHTAVVAATSPISLSPSPSQFLSLPASPYSSITSQRCRDKMAMAGAFEEGKMEVEGGSGQWGRTIVGVGLRGGWRPKWR